MARTRGIKQQFKERQEGLQTITEESGCMDQHSTERLKTRTPLEAEGQQLLHERFVSRCNEDIRARPLMNAHSHMDEKGNDRQRTRQHNGPEKDIFRRPERNIENMHYQNTRFQDFQDCSGQGDRVSNRETNRQEAQNSGQQTNTDKRTCMLHQGKKFSSRNQKPREKAEEYAAELKRIAPQSLSQQRQTTKKRRPA
ncbi:Hypothetical predicted protein [Mytilus galloprovincialis]|uniref:Uncharacterized protein n=1 Tax=Mytilus galloprovincialis TaxID=29158 RepID=A0A8B6C127_MYTGA|nr:Hypothetical predicted protein [Mytilus galloprovincialis]